MDAPDVDSEETIDIFVEPEGYFRKEKQHSFEQYTLKSGQNLSLRLVGQSPLWGHLLWQAARVVTAYIEDHAEDLVRHKTILELGAGSGLPSLVAAAHNAKRVVVTDYPDNDLIENLRFNIDHCGLTKDASIVAKGFLWGTPTDELKTYLDSSDLGFDLLILADILFNHSEHAKLVKTLMETLSKKSSSVALVFFTPYRPWLLDKDLHFFEMAREKGLIVTKVLEQQMEEVMFENDPGDEVLRKTVFGYTVKWNVKP